MDYHDFIRSKQVAIKPAGFETTGDLNPLAKEFQRAICHWGLRLGRAGVFTDTGLGKSLTAIIIAEQIIAHTGGQFLLVAPLAVGRQFLSEAKKFNTQVSINVCSSQESVRPGITITNYEKLHKFDPREFVGIGLDEASILASLDGKYRNYLIEEYGQVIPYRYCFTATPSPNDIMEIGSYAEFLGVMKRSEMLATFFVHDGGDTAKWRLKRHAEKEFYRWMASWSVMLRKPSGLGFSDDGYNLPELRIHEHVIQTKTPTGFLFTMDARTLHEQRDARRETIGERTELLASLANESRDEPWVVWCGLNDESTAASNAIHNAIEVTGSQADWQKEQNLIDFIDQRRKKLVSKTKIAGFGLNLQFCNKMGFLGLSHSYIGFYQAIRRIWRFGQTKPCDIHVVVSDRDGAVLKSIHRKQQQHEQLIDGMAAATNEWTRQEILGSGVKREDYQPREIMDLPSWLQSNRQDHLESTQEMAIR